MFKMPPEEALRHLSVASHNVQVYMKKVNGMMIRFNDLREDVKTKTMEQMKTCSSLEAKVDAFEKGMKVMMDGMTAMNRDFLNLSNDLNSRISSIESSV